jgi:hypothetical protein
MEIGWGRRLASRRPLGVRRGDAFGGSNPLRKGATRSRGGWLRVTNRHTVRASQLGQADGGSRMRSGQPAPPTAAGAAAHSKITGAPALVRHRSDHPQRPLIFSKDWLLAVGSPSHLPRGGLLLGGCDAPHGRPPRRCNIAGSRSRSAPRPSWHVVAVTKGLGKRRRCVARQLKDLVQFYRDKAEETRTLAEGMTEPSARANMLDIASMWERLAKQAEQSREPTSD